MTDWQTKNLDRSHAKNKEWRERNGFSIRLRMARWRASNKAKIKAYNKQYVSENIVRLRAVGKSWRTRNHERFMVKHKSRVARYEASHPGSRTARVAKRRAIRRQATVNPKFIVEFTNLIRSKKFVRCYYCDRKVHGKAAHIDHVVPLNGKTLRGSHEVGNLCAACPKCNQSKTNKPIHEWNKDRSGQQILSL